MRANDFDWVKELEDAIAELEASQQEMLLNAKIDCHLTLRTIFMEYTDKSTWPVRAFINATEADQFASECQLEADSIWYYIQGDRHRPYNKKPELDPNLHFDYTGTHYYVSGPIPFERPGV